MKEEQVIRSEDQFLNNRMTIIFILKFRRLTSGGRDQEHHGSRPVQAKNENLSQKYATQKRAEEVAQVLECSNSEALSSNSSTTKK
jgi:hypothetical protein